METVLSIPSRPFIADLSPPGALLRADIDRPVPFHGRERELEELQSWSMSERPFQLRVLTGGGGMGKTRLMTEFCQIMVAKRWTSGFLEKTINADMRPILAAALGTTDKALVVIDYAENRRSHAVDLIATALERLGRNRLRVVLLARAADDWWEALRGEGGGVGDVLAGPACSRSALRPLAATVEERRASYELAVRHFAAVLSKPPRQDAELDFTDRAFDRALLLHMAALAAVESVAVKGDQGILDHALDRERRFWRERAQTLGLDPLYERAILQAVAAITLVGGAHDRAAAVRILGGLALLRSERAVVLDTVAQLLHDTYSGEQWIDPILPDLLGEHVVQNALEEDSGSLLDTTLGTARL